MADIYFLTTASSALCLNPIGQLTKLTGNITVTPEQIPSKNGSSLNLTNNNGVTKLMFKGIVTAEKLHEKMIELLGSKTDKVITLEREPSGFIFFNTK